MLPSGKFLIRDCSHRGSKMSFHWNCAIFRVELLVYQMVLDWLTLVKLSDLSDQVASWKHPYEFGKFQRNWQVDHPQESRQKKPSSKHTKKLYSIDGPLMNDLPNLIAWWIFPVRKLLNYQAMGNLWIPMGPAEPINQPGSVSICNEIDPNFSSVDINYWFIKGLHNKTLFFETEWNGVVFPNFCHALGLGLTMKKHIPSTVRCCVGLNVRPQLHSQNRVAQIWWKKDHPKKGNAPKNVCIYIWVIWIIWIIWIIMGKL